MLLWMILCMDWYFSPQKADFTVLPLGLSQVNSTHYTLCLTRLLKCRSSLQPHKCAVDLQADTSRISHLGDGTLVPNTKVIVYFVLWLCTVKFLSSFGSNIMPGRTMVFPLPHKHSHHRSTWCETSHFLSLNVWKCSFISKVTLLWWERWILPL